ncbi:MAG: hypothetical protein HY900_03560 [Deltaproteobacteria bacterium]|nr:hypothetical protein [Deltaproteobacteria bacterium]
MAVVLLHVATSRATSPGCNWRTTFVEVEALVPGLRDRILDAAWEVGLAHNLVIAPLVLSREDVEDTPLRASPILKVIAEEGVPV